MYRVVALSALLGACGPGSVKVDGTDDFGKVRSGVWFEIQSGSATWHSFALLDAPSACTEARDMLEATAVAEAVVRLKLEPLSADPAAQCTVYKAHYAQMAELTNPLFGGGLHVLGLTLRDPSDDADDAPPEGSYERFDAEGSGDKPYFLGTLTYYSDNPYQIQADVFDCGAAFQDELADRQEAAVETWLIAAGEVEAQRAKSDNAYKISVDGDLEDIDGNSGGSLSAKGLFEHCEIAYEGDSSVTL